jgi:hypothetical protein
MIKGYIVSFFMNGGRTYYVHKDGAPTLNRDSAYVFPTFEAAKIGVETFKRRPNRYRQWGFGFLAVEEPTAMRRSPSAGWELKARMLRLFNDHHECGMANLSQHTRDSTVYIANLVRDEIAQDRKLVWC